jgi:hypothetical protein
MWTMVDASKAVGRAAREEAHWYGDGAITEDTTRSALAATIAKASGMSVSEVESKLGGLSPDDYKAFMGTTLAGGRDLGGAASKDVLRGSEERYRGSTRRSALTATRDEIDAIKTDLSKMEESWGIGSSTGQDELRKLVAGGRGAGELLSILYAKESGGLSEENKTGWWKRITAQVAKEMNLKEDDPKVQSRVLGYMQDSGGIEMSKDAVRGLNKIMESDKGFEDFATYVGQGVTGLQASQLGVSAIAGISDELELTGDNVLKTGQNLFSLSPEQQEELSKSAKYGNIGKLLMSRRDATGGKRAELTSQIEQAVAMAGSEGGGSESIFGGFGDKIMSLITSDKKMSEVADQMAAAFKNFNPETARSFKDGAIALQEAMQSGSLKLGTPGEYK